MSQQMLGSTNTQGPYKFMAQSSVRHHPPAMFREEQHQEQQHQHQHHQRHQPKKQPVPQRYQIVCCDQPHHGEPSNTSSQFLDTYPSKNFSASPTTLYPSTVSSSDASLNCCTPPMSFDPECYDCSFECTEVNLSNCSIGPGSSDSPAPTTDCIDCSIAMEDHSTASRQPINLRETECCFEPDCSDGLSEDACGQIRTRVGALGEDDCCDDCSVGADEKTESEGDKVLECCGRGCGHQHSWNCGFDKPEAGFDQIFACYHPNTTPFPTPSELIPGQDAPQCAIPDEPLSQPSSSSGHDPQFHLPYPNLKSSSSDGPLSALNILLEASNMASSDVSSPTFKSMSSSVARTNSSEYSFPMDSLTGSLPDSDLSTPLSITTNLVNDGDSYQSFTPTPNLTASPLATPPSDLEPLMESSFMNCQWSDCHETFPSLDELIEHFRTTSSHIPLSCLTSSESPMTTTNTPVENLGMLSSQMTTAVEAAKNAVSQQTSIDGDPFGRAPLVSAHPAHLHCQWGQDHAFTLSDYQTAFPSGHSPLDAYNLNAYNAGAQQSVSDQLSPNQVDFLLKHLLEEHLTGNHNLQHLAQSSQPGSVPGSYLFPTYPGATSSKPATSFDSTFGPTGSSALNKTWTSSAENPSSPSSPSSLSTLSVDRSSGKAATNASAAARVLQNHPYRARTTLPVPCASRPQLQSLSGRSSKATSDKSRGGSVPGVKREENGALKTDKQPKAEEEHMCGYPGCKAKFPDTATLTDHLNVVHVGSGKDVYRCGWEGCERAMHGPVFKSKQKIMRHLQSHTNHKPFVCELCNQTFSEAATLQQHIRRHSNEKPFVCDFPGCDKAFALIGSLTIHKRTHDGIKPFKCSFCDKSFVEASNLNKHIRTHTGERPHKCEYPGCEKRFARPDQLSRHQNVHRKKEAKVLALKNELSITS